MIYMSGLVTMPISYCIKKGRYDASGNTCNPSIPLSKMKKGLNPSTNTTSISQRMRYSQIVNQSTYVEPSAQQKAKYAARSNSLGLRTRDIGAPTYSY